MVYQVVFLIHGLENHPQAHHAIEESDSMEPGFGVFPSEPDARWTMIDHASSAASSAAWTMTLKEGEPPPPPCYAPWVFMEIHDLFGDGSPEGDIVRIGCLHERAPDGSCQSGAPTPGTACLRRAPSRRNVRLTGGSGLPRDRIHEILQDGDEPVLEFEEGSNPSDSVLQETAHLLRKLRNTGINATVTGLSVAQKAKLGRMEWKR